MTTQTLLAAITGPTKAKPEPKPIILTQEITFTKSVIHACVQHAGREINDALGVDDRSLLDQFLTTEAGKAWIRGFREYAIFALGKSA